ncbi:HAD-IA family hydrolase [Microbacterium sp. NPDC056234]|uniref:HAD-IA family hydrolase n=1 Tax=Microbacterium sp. NPDC056234 TaxID=3345757 RepID=UPI0035D768EE
MREHARTRTMLVFDVLGTLVDQTGSLERQVASVTALDGEAVADVVARWLGFVSVQEKEILAGRRSFVPSEGLDAEALANLSRAGLISEAEVSHLLDASQRLSVWPDTLAGMNALSAEHIVTGLSNASRRVLTGLSADSGMRWHGVFSAQESGTYKPDPAVYRLALANSPLDAAPPFLIAAHSWDLRAARAAGMRTAYVPRPNGEPPEAGERFDIHAVDLADLAVQLRRR